MRTDQFKAVDINWFLNYTFKALTINLIIYAIMYTTQGLYFWGLQSYNGGRFGGGYLSLLAVTVIYAVYDYFMSKAFLLLGVLLTLHWQFFVRFYPRVEHM